jgi:AraC-like DNA-binding protein
MADPLDDLIRLLRPRAAAWKQIDATGRWAIEFPANPHVNLGVVAHGRCLLRGTNGTSQLETGDFLLLAASSPFAFASDPDSAPIEGERIAEGGRGNRVVLGAGEDRAVRLIAGHVMLDAVNAALLLDVMAVPLHLRAREAVTHRITRLIDLVIDEAAADRQGSAVVQERLAEIMLIEALRSQAADEDRPYRGMLGGLRDPQIAPALAAIHGDVRHAWTVVQLAQTVRMSRSVFAERFQRRVGLSPIEYLTAWRMALAKSALSRGDRTIAMIARDTGYGSASAFSVAFHRVVGAPPSHYASSAPPSVPARRPHKRVVALEPAGFKLESEINGRWTPIELSHGLHCTPCQWRTGAFGVSPVPVPMPGGDCGLGSVHRCSIAVPVCGCGARPRHASRPTGLRRWLSTRCPRPAPDGRCGRAVRRPPRYEQSRHRAGRHSRNATGTGPGSSVPRPDRHRRTGAAAAVASGRDRPRRTAPPQRTRRCSTRSRG